MTLAQLYKAIMNIKRHPIPEFITLDRLGDSTLVHVRRSQRAKRISIRIRHEKVELILPGSNFNKAKGFLLDKESWIRRKLEPRQKQIIYNPDNLIIFDTEYSLEYVYNTEPKVQLCDNSIIVHSANSNKAHQDTKKHPKRQKREPGTDKGVPKAPILTPSSFSKNGGC